MVMAISKEIHLQNQYLIKSPLQSIYFGGGTPSILENKELKTILDTVYSVHEVTENPEITLEANPDDLSESYLRGLKQAGINRLSIGIQSFDDQVLKFLNRAHNSAEALGAFHLANEAGFDNISIDLIYGIPNQDDEMWLKNIAQAIAFNPNHISCYALTIEPKTVFGNWTENNRMPPLDEDMAARQFEILVQELKAAGYIHYEVSNFAKPAKLAVHNSNYWKSKSYLGIGPGAHSYNLETRQYNVSNNPKYVASLEKGQLIFELEYLSPKDKINEYLLTSLRTIWGANLSFLKTELGYELPQRHILLMEEQGLAKIEANHLILTEKGWLIADTLIFKLCPS